MILPPHISILHRPRQQTPPNYCLEFSGNGHIAINPLNAFLDHRINFMFRMDFKVNTFPSSGFAYLMNSCLVKNSNQAGIAINSEAIFVQVNKGDGLIVELSAPFNDFRYWHTITLINDRDNISAYLDEDLLSVNIIPTLTLPQDLGFRIASSTANNQFLTGLVDNILITNLITPIAHYPLNEGTGTIAYDAVGDYDGSIVGGGWVLK